LNECFLGCFELAKRSKRYLKSQKICFFKAEKSYEKRVFCNFNYRFDLFDAQAKFKILHCGNKTFSFLEFSKKPIKPSKSAKL